MVQYTIADIFTKYFYNIRAFFNVPVLRCLSSLTHKLTLDLLVYYFFLIGY